MHFSSLLISGLIAGATAQTYPWDDPVAAPAPDYPGEDPSGEYRYPWDDPAPNRPYPPPPPASSSTTPDYPTSDSTTAEPTAPTATERSTVVVTGTTTVVETSTERVTRMPSLSSIISTTILTTSILPTLAVAVFPDAIEGLPDCDQSVVFDSLADSLCNPADFQCICGELTRLGVRAAVAADCSVQDVLAYDAFVNDFCLNNRQVSTVTAPISTAPSSPLPPPANSTVPFPVPNNSTAPIPTGSPVAPTSLTTTVVIVTTDAAGQPTTRTTALPAAPTSPDSPEFTGGAMPEFGTIRAGLLAGGIGLMGLVFAEF